jgi:glycosyltransferase involved in cell wall biosynthesis
MACGLPVMRVKGSASENIIDGTTGYLLQDPMNHIELAEIILRLAGDRPAAEKIGAAAAQYVKTSVSWDRNACEFLENSLASRQS